MTVVALSVGRFPVFCYPSPVLSGNTACASNSINPKVIPYESTIPSYMRYLPAIPSKFVCAKLQTFKWNFVLYTRAAHVSTRAAYIFHARWVTLKRSGLRSSFTRKWLVTGMPSPMLKSNHNNCKQNSPRIVVSWTAPVVSDKPQIDFCWWWGSINFTILFGNRL